MVNKEPILKVDNLILNFRQGSEETNALRGISFQLYQGETLGIVGESGSGKSITSLSIMKLLAEPPAIYKGGKISYTGATSIENILSEKDLIRDNFL